MDRVGVKNSDRPCDLRLRPSWPPVKSVRIAFLEGPSGGPLPPSGEDEIRVRRTQVCANRLRVLFAIENRGLELRTPDAGLIRVAGQLAAYPSEGAMCWAVSSTSTASQLEFLCPLHADTRPRSSKHREPSTFKVNDG